MSTNTLAALVAERAGQQNVERQHRTRTLTGRARPPLITVAGGPKVGKSYAIAEAAADPRVARVRLVEVGGDRGAADEYGAIPGVADRLELIEHDNTWADVAAAVQQAVAQPPVDVDGHDVLAIDGATSLWALLSRHAQRGGRDIGPGGWAAVNAAWDDLLDVLRTHPGPVVLTARTDAAGLVGDELGRVRTQKDLAFEADVVVQATGHRAFTLVGARTLALAHAEVSLPLGLGDLVLADLLDLLTGGGA